jgi:hypothetical protein
MGRCVPRLLAAALRPARTRLTSTNHPHDTEGGPPRRGRSRRAPGRTGQRALPPHRTQTDMTLKTGASTISNHTSKPLND